MSLIRWMGAWDIHGDKQDPQVVAAFFQHVEDFKPQIRVIGGDLIDLRPLRKGANAEERKESMRSDIDAGMRFLTRFKPTHWLLGNHEQRLWDGRYSNDGIIADLCTLGVNDFTARAQRLNCKVLPYHKRSVLKLTRQLGLMHGFFFGKNAAKQHAEVYDTVAFGHTHRIARYQHPALESRVGFNVGCLCDLDMAFEARSPGTLAHAHGWPYGVINDKTDSFQLWQAEKMDDKWLLPTNLKAIG